MLRIRNRLRDCRWLKGAEWDVPYESLWDGRPLSDLPQAAIWEMGEDQDEAGSGTNRIFATVPVLILVAFAFDEKDEERKPRAQAHIYQQQLRRTLINKAGDSVLPEDIAFDLWPVSWVIQDVVNEGQSPIAVLRSNWELRYDYDVFD